MILRYLPRKFNVVPCNCSFSSTVKIHRQLRTEFQENRVGDSYGQLAYNLTRSMGTSGFNALFFCCPPYAMSQDSILSPKAPNQIICSPPGTIINSFCQLYVLALQTQNTKPDSNQILNRNETLTVFCE